MKKPYCTTSMKTSKYFKGEPIDKLWLENYGIRQELCSQVCAKVKQPMKPGHDNLPTRKSLLRYL